ncbi:glycosyltransferase family 2 protein [uncultured Fibrobacter sp.]|uniref:glycosyltransferase family 2 protein n=1 Tax=uncultured Fibrobacter sp. TaxID=261512 RepID=UPI0026326FA5|nr:glycosyltransferase family 2 protein [uncultured Fibrobacter sp.]
MTAPHKKISIVFTCHNRVEKTKNCLETISKAVSLCSDLYDVSLYVCDDGSDDGTREMLQSFSSIPCKIACGNGNLFWARGMALAMQIAEKDAADYYLFINDDVSFYPDFLTTILKDVKENCAVVGCTLDTEEKICSYGGFTWEGCINKRKNYRRVTPESLNRNCKWANWNCFLLPQKMYGKIGKIDDYYEHSFADYDYSNRIVNAGFEMVVADKYIGVCNRNSREGTYLDLKLSIAKRFRLLHKRTGCPPKSSWHYAKKFFGIYAPFVFLKPYAYIVVTSFPLYKWKKRKSLA